jgi:cell division protein FtsN
MAKDFFREKNNPVKTVGSKGSIRQAILLVILLITAGLGYLYFFTGIIKPREHIENTPPPTVPPLKQPLPPRLTEEAVEQASTAAKEEQNISVPAKTEKTAPASTSAESKQDTIPSAESKPPKAVKPAAPPVTKYAAIPAAKKTASSTKKPASPSTPPQSGKIIKPGEKPAAKADAKTQAVSSSQTTKPAKGSETQPSGESPTKDKRPEQAATGGKYRLLIGGAAESKEAEKIRTNLTKLGITDINVRTVKKTETMHRIFLGEFDNQAAANAEFNQLKTNAGGAFVLRENGRYLLYAGSYLSEGKAKVELKRLQGKGLKPNLKSAKVSITVNEILAGSFPDSKEAQKEAQRLKKKGIASIVIKAGQ